MAALDGEHRGLSLGEGDGAGGRMGQRCRDRRPPGRVAICTQKEYDKVERRVNFMGTMRAMSETRQGMRFAAVLRATRRAAGVSYRGLAKVSGVSHSFLSHVEKGERRAPPVTSVITLADALDADRITFALAAIADRAGRDVGAVMAAALQRGPVGRDVDPTAGGVLIESGPGDAEADLERLAQLDHAVAEIEARLSFVDLQLDAGFLRLGLGVKGSDPIVLLVSAEAEREPADE